MKEGYWSTIPWKTFVFILIENGLFLFFLWKTNTHVPTTLWKNTSPSHIVVNCRPYLRDFSSNEGSPNRVLRAKGNSNQLLRDSTNASSLPSQKISLDYGSRLIGKDRSSCWGLYQVFIFSLQQPWLPHARHWYFLWPWQLLCSESPAASTVPWHDQII